MSEKEPFLFPEMEPDAPKEKPVAIELPKIGETKEKKTNICVSFVKIRDHVQNVNMVYKG